MKKYIFILAVIFTITTNLFTQPIIINTPMIWNSSMIVTGDVTIQPPGSLTITNNCTIYFPPGSTLVAFPGCRITINNATLTSASTSARWGGIRIYGNSSLYPNHPTQNGVTMTNGHILHAETAVIAYNSAYTNATNSSFGNNKIGVWFQPITSAMGISGNFRQTNFYVDNGYIGSSSNFNYESHIKANGSGNLLVTGCNFTSTVPLNPFSNLNRGIDIINNYLSVTEYCSSGIIEMPSGKCRYGTPSYFTGFNHAIYATHTGTIRTLSVKFSTFYDNLYGITNNAINNSILYYNTFYLLSPNSYGMRVSYATGYSIRENKFYGLTTPTIGTYIAESGGAENQVYRNEYYYLTIGQHFAGKNSVQTTSNETGLQTLCNTFEYTNLDILVSGVVANPPSIRRDQGSLLRPAGNRFSQNVPYNFESHSTFPIIYYYSTFDPIEKPVIAPNSLTVILNYPVNLARNCPMSENPPIESALSEYDELNSEYEYWLNQLLAFIGDDGKEYEELLQQVSYFSAAKDNLFNAIIAEALCEEEVQIENIRYLFTYRGNYADYLGLAETYLLERDYSEAMTILSKMYKQFEVTEEQILELKGLETYSLWLQQLEKEEKNIYELSGKEIDYLVNFVETNIGRGVVYAKNILCAWYNICLENTELPKFSTPDPVSPPLQIDDKALLDKITVVPNPTTGELRVTSNELQVTNIEVFDIHGRKLLSSPVSQQQTLDISHLQAGIYFVKIITEQGEIVKRIVKQ